MESGSDGSRAPAGPEMQRACSHLDHHREADLLREPERLGGAPRRLARARDHRKAERLGLGARRRVSGLGPMKAIPARSQASASSGFSERKP